MKLLVTLLFSWAWIGLLGCRSAAPRNGPYAPQVETSRNPSEAQRLTEQAAEIIDSNPARAEELLRGALTADLHHGPAHNNLGVIYLSRGQLYEAAAEFEWARKLMPGHPDPRINLGIALEGAGRYRDAIDTYRAALESRPGHLGAMQALATCQLKHGEADAQTPELLEEIAMRGDPEWRRWARERLTRYTR